MIRDLYLPRWEAWFNYKLALLKGEKVEKPDYFNLEQAWVNNGKKYDEPVDTQSINIVADIYKSYIDELRQSYKNS